MQLSAIFVSLLGTAAAFELPSHIRSEPPTMVERDLPTITKTIDNADGRIKELTTAIQGFNGDPTQLSQAAGNLLSTLKQGVTDVTATSSISLNDAISLQQQVSGLQNDGNALISALNDKKTSFENAGLCDIVYKQAGDMGSVAKNLIDAVVSKVPQDVQSLAQQIASGFSNSLTSTQQNFAPGNCTNRNGAVAPGATGTGPSGSRPSGGSSSPAIAAAGSFVAPVGMVFVVFAATFLL